MLEKIRTEIREIEKSFRSVTNCEVPIIIICHPYYHTSKDLKLSNREREGECEREQYLKRKKEKRKKIKIKKKKTFSYILEQKKIMHSSESPNRRVHRVWETNYKEEAKQYSTSRQSHSWDRLQDHTFYTRPDKTQACPLLFSSQFHLRIFHVSSKNGGSPPSPSFSYLNIFSLSFCPCDSLSLFLPIG